MRDLVITILVFGSILLILSRPYVGILVWSWLSYMNPHRLTWGFAYDFPFAQIIAITLMIAMLMSREPKRIPIQPITFLWVLFVIWMGVSTIFAIFPESAQEQYLRVVKIQLVTFLTMMVMTTRERLNWLVWTIVLSVGFFSVKGGIFALATGGEHRIWGPPESYIADNNTLALAALMIVPLMRYLYGQHEQRWIRLGLVAAMGFTGVSVLASYSRGAFVAAACMVMFFWMKGSKKLVTGLLLLLLIPPLLAFMPARWHDRMESIQNYEEDSSAMGRLNAWQYAINVANARVTGAGYESWSFRTFRVWAPDPSAVHAAHSIWFSVLADHGWPGLAMYVMIYLLAWRCGSWVVRRTRGVEELKWAQDLARAVQVSLIAYFTGGSFLSLSYFDLPWHLVAILVLTRQIVGARLQEIQSAKPAPVSIYSQPHAVAGQRRISAD